MKANFDCGEAWGDTDTHSSEVMFKEFEIFNKALYSQSTSLIGLIEGNIYEDSGATEKLLKNIDSRFKSIFDRKNSIPQGYMKSKRILKIPKKTVFLCDVDYENSRINLGESCSFFYFQIGMINPKDYPLRACFLLLEEILCQKIISEISNMNNLANFSVLSKIGGIYGFQFFLPSLSLDDIRTKFDDILTEKNGMFNTNIFIIENIINKTLEELQNSDDFLLNIKQIIKIKMGNVSDYPSMFFGARDHGIDIFTQMSSWGKNNEDYVPVEFKSELYNRIEPHLMSTTSDILINIVKKIFVERKKCMILNLYSRPHSMKTLSKKEPKIFEKDTISDNINEKSEDFESNFKNIAQNKFKMSFKDGRILKNSCLEDLMISKLGKMYPVESL